MSNIERNVVYGRYSGLALLMDVCHLTGCKFSSEHTLLACLSWRSRTKDAFGAVRHMCSELGERGRRNAHDHGQICSCAPEVYRLSVHALYVYIATSYAVEQTLQPVITVARMWAASIPSVALPSAFGPRMDPSLNTSDRDATSCRRRGIVKRCTTAARVGRTSRVRSGLPQRRVGSNDARNVPAVAW